MPYLMRLNVRPDQSQLQPHEASEIQRVFDTYAAEVLIHGQPIGWSEIDEVELVIAPSVSGVMGWLIDQISKSETTYHLGIYLGRDEAVLANITERQALYVLQAIAYYAPRPVRYNGPDGIVPLTTI